MNIPCYFCQIPAVASQIAGDVWKAICPQCPEICSTYHKWMGGEEHYFWGASITFGDNGKDYSAFFTDKSFRVNLLEVSEIDGQLRHAKGVMVLSFCPTNITPHNIRQKFQTLKVWS